MIAAFARRDAEGALNGADDLIRRTVIQKLDRYAEGIGKSDDKLREDLKDLQKEGAASRLQKLYEKLRSLDD